MTTHSTQLQSEYCEISTELFLGMTGVIPFDVYIQLSPNKFTKICHRNEKLDHSRVQTYMAKGVKALFISRSDRREYIGATERFIKNMMNKKDFKIEDGARAIEELSEQTMFELFEDHLVDDALFRRAQELTKIYVDFLKKDIRVLSTFLQLCRNETYMVRHSIGTSVFGILIARAAGNINDRTLEIIGLGGLIHDVGMSTLPPEISDLDRKLTAEEYSQMKSHTHVGSNLVEQIKNFPEEIKLIIEQHHESYDGSGYPRGFHGDEIFYPARVIAIADCFSAVTARRGGRALMSPEEGLALLHTEKHRYDPKLLKAFTELLASGRKKKAA